MKRRGFFATLAAAFGAGAVKAAEPAKTAMLTLDVIVTDDPFFGACRVKATFNEKKLNTVVHADRVQRTLFDFWNRSAASACQ